jgi:hypothetical protein
LRDRFFLTAYGRDTAASIYILINLLSGAVSQNLRVLASKEGHEDREKFGRIQGGVEDLMTELLKVTNTSK